MTVIFSKLDCFFKHKKYFFGSEKIFTLVLIQKGKKQSFTKKSESGRKSEKKKKK